MVRTKKRKPGAKQRELKAKMESEKTKAPKQTHEQMYALALEYAEQSQPEMALKHAKQLWSEVRGRSATEALPALNLLGEISIELGAVHSARNYFEQAVQLDPEGKIPEALGGGAEKFLWLAQLSEEGGQQSVQWFEKGANALQNEIVALENGQVQGLDEEMAMLLRIEKKRKLANALCGIVEVYMTDLSWEDDAEARCERLITQALTVEDDTSPEVLQTLASVRLSQERKEDAQSALKRSLDSWIELDPEDAMVPDFATQISLARLLMEANMEREAMDVLHRLVQEDDQSVEAWYLGGWCQHLLAERSKTATDLRSEADMDISADGAAVLDEKQNQMTTAALRGSRRWLNQSLKLYKQLDYEDDRLRDHATELVATLDAILGPEGENAGEGDEGEWEDEWDGIEDDEDGDEEMEDS